MFDSVGGAGGSYSINGAAWLQTEDNPLRSENPRPLRGVQHRADPGVRLSDSQPTRQPAGAKLRACKAGSETRYSYEPAL